MFYDMPEMTPGAQITKKPHIKIHASQYIMIKLPWISNLICFDFVIINCHICH